MQFHKDLIHDCKEEIAFLDSLDKEGKKALIDKWRANSKKRMNIIRNGLR